MNYFKKNIAHTEKFLTHIINGELKIISRMSMSMDFQVIKEKALAQDPVSPGCSPGPRPGYMAILHYLFQ